MNNVSVLTEVASSYGPAGSALVSASVVGGAEPDIEAVRRQLAAWFGPAVRDWRHLRTYTNREALPAYAPGADLARDVRLADGLYACGDRRLHPSLSGALGSGRRAAEAVLADLRR